MTASHANRSKFYDVKSYFSYQIKYIQQLSVIAVMREASTRCNSRDQETLFVVIDSLFGRARDAHTYKAVGRD